MNKEDQNTELKKTPSDGVEKSEAKVLSNLSHAQQSSKEKEIVLTKRLNCVSHSDRIEQQLNQQQRRACLCAQNLLCFHNSTTNLSSTHLTNQLTNGLKCSSVSKLCNCISNFSKHSSENSSKDNISHISKQSSKCANHKSDNQLSKDCLDKCSNESSGLHNICKVRTQQSKKVKRIGVFYSDLCDVVKSMRSFSSQSNNSSFKSDKPDKENLLDNCGTDNKVIKTMVKTPLNQQKTRSNELPNQQNDLNQQNKSNSKLNANQQPYFTEDKTNNKMNEQLITKDKKSLLSKVSSSEQNLFKQFNHSQLLLQVPAENTNYNQHNTNRNTTSTEDEVDAFRLLNSQNAQQSNNVSNSAVATIAVNGQTTNANLINNSQQNRQTISNVLPDLLQNNNNGVAHISPPPAYSTLPIDHPIGTLTLRQLARLQHQSIPINSLPTNLTSPLSLNIARSRNSATALLNSAPLSPNNLLNAARVHQSSLSADNYRNTLSNCTSLTNQLSVPTIQPNSTNNNHLPSTVPQLTTVTQPTTVLPTVVPPHVHHQFRFPLNAHRFATSTGFLGPDLDAITQSKSCLSCTNIGLRWGILLIAFIGLLCAIVGTCLFAVRHSGRDNFTLAIILLGKSCLKLIYFEIHI